jgi:cytochrome P450
MRRIDDHDTVRAALAHPDLTVPAVPPASGPPDLAWLRAHVARFSEGEGHDRRRGYATAALDRVDPAELHRHASELTRSLRAEQSTVDDSRTVPVTVLAAALGIDADPADVAEVAQWYLTDSDSDSDSAASTVAADAAVARLVQATGESDDERAAALVGLLVQSYTATARLITQTRAEQRVELETTRVATVDVPELGLRAGDSVRLDLAAAGLLFGSGRHACPGAEHARAITAGVTALPMM